MTRVNDTSSNRSKKIAETIRDELLLSPPLLPVKFGNGLLFQYLLNDPDTDDNLGILPIGLVVGCTSLVLLMLTMVSETVVKAPIFSSGRYTEKINMVVKVSRWLNAIFYVLQVVSIIALFCVCVFHYGDVNILDVTSNHYVKRRVYRYSLLISGLMVGCIIFTAIVLAYLCFIESDRVEKDENGAARLNLK